MSAQPLRAEPSEAAATGTSYPKEVRPYRYTWADRRPVASFADVYHGDIMTIESQLPFGVWPVRGKASATP